MGQYSTLYHICTRTWLCVPCSFKFHFSSSITIWAFFCLIDQSEKKFFVTGNSSNFMRILKWVEIKERKLKPIIDVHLIARNEATVTPSRSFSPGEIIIRFRPRWSLSRNGHVQRNDLFFFYFSINRLNGFSAWKSSRVRSKLILNRDTHKKTHTRTGFASLNFLRIRIFKWSFFLGGKVPLSLSLRFLL